MEKKRISTSVYSFEKLRNEGFLYVDKTMDLYRLVSMGSAHVFCARPRRFGKSLTLSVLDAIFRGRRDLFSSQNEI